MAKAQTYKNGKADCLQVWGNISLVSMGLISTQGKTGGDMEHSRRKPTETPHSEKSIELQVYENRPRETHWAVTIGENNMLFERQLVKHAGVYSVQPVDLKISNNCKGIANSAVVRPHRHDRIKLLWSRE